jgi:hypothetical protein
MRYRPGEIVFGDTPLIYWSNVKNAMVAIIPYVGLSIEKIPTNTSMNIAAALNCLKPNRKTAIIKEIRIILHPHLPSPPFSRFFVLLVSDFDIDVDASGI